jgi:hypothetical protein
MFVPSNTIENMSNVDAVAAVWIFGVLRWTAMVDELHDIANVFVSALSAVVCPA